MRSRPDAVYEKHRAAIIPSFDTGWDTDPERTISFFFMTSAADIFEETVLRLSRDHMFLCSPSGQLLKFDVLTPLIESHVAAGSAPVFKGEDTHFVTSDAKMPRHFFDSFHLMTETMAGFVERLKRKKDNPNNLGPFAFFDEDYMGMSIRSGFKKVPLFYERSAYTITLKGYDFISEHLESWDEFVDHARTLRPFEGWSMCVPDEFVSEWDRAILNHKRVKPSEDAPSTGRPPKKIDATKEAYAKLYPNGHGNASLKVVLQAIFKFNGENISVDTLKRALTKAAE